MGAESQLRFLKPLRVPQLSDCGHVATACTGTIPDMAIFSRRVLQRLLDQTEGLLLPQQRERRLELLNAANERSLDFEWETVLLAGLRQFGSVEYEPDLGGATRPDLRVTGDSFEFVADVVTVNDSGYEKANPFERFQREFWRRVAKAGLPASPFHLQVGGDHSARKPSLLIPTQQNWPTFFDANFEALLQSIRESPAMPAVLHRKTSHVDVHVRYTPGQLYAGAGYPSYRRSDSVTENPIYNALKRKKDQLKRSGYEGLVGIILCDGDCDDLSHPNRIIHRFLNGTSSIAFVAVFTMSGDRFSRRQRPIRPQAKCFVNPLFHADRRVMMIGDLLSRLVPAVLPDAQDDVANALNQLRSKDGHVGLPFSGGWTYNEGKSMQLSSRALLDLLAGNITGEKFMADHGFAPGSDTPNPFKRFLAQGRMICGIHVDRSESEDDDWVVFEFGDRDPAISDFRTAAK